MKRIAVTGSGGQIAYNLLFRIANGDVFGINEEIELNLIDLPQMKRVMEGVVMELEDSAFPLLKTIRFGSDAYTLFDKIDVAFLVGAKPRGPGMERQDLLKENGKIFVEVGRALDAVASKSATILIVGNPCNTNCLIAMEHAPSLSKRNFHAMMRLDQNRATALLAKKGGVMVRDVKGVVIWGNHSTTQVPDFTQARIGNQLVTDVISDQSWLQENFTETIQKRGAAVIKARGKSSAASAANAAVDAMRSLYIPTPEGEWFTSAVCSDGNPYGIEEGLIFGFPCRSKGDGTCDIVPNLPWDYFIREKVAVTQKELLEERNMVKNLIDD